MAKWVFEPGHTAAEFCVRHMMVTWVRGHFKNVHGSLEFDADDPRTLSLEATIDTKGIWTGEPQRDEHLRSADFLDAERCPVMMFRSTGAQRTAASDYRVHGDLTIRGVTRTVTLDMYYLGKWRTPYNSHQVTRVGFTGQTRVNRHDFAVDWSATMESAGAVVGDDVLITIDVEGILETELKPILAQAAKR